MKRIAVGSTNPAKVSAVESVAARIWPDAQVAGFSVSSGVSDQPMTDEEAIAGALNRARGALEAMDADLGIGLEGSTADSPRGMYLCGWVAAISREGVESVAGGGRVMLPDVIAQRLRAGCELGPVMDELRGSVGTKTRDGAVGFLTGGLVPRSRAFEVNVSFALARFINPELYSSEGIR